ncbi:hypothetical protein PG985_005500 [Apiospora marii]|uniref:uncharacterized protein n=1 Tax=Apiospora marii TaxID=335849 RepID=UPI00313102F0
MFAETYPVVSLDGTEKWAATTNSISINQNMLAADLGSSFWLHGLLETFLLPKFDSFEPEELSAAIPGYGDNEQACLSLDKPTAVDLSSLPTLQQLSQERPVLGDVLAFLDSNPGLLDEEIWFDSQPTTIPSSEPNNTTDSLYPTGSTREAAPTPKTPTSPKSHREPAPDAATRVTENKALPPAPGPVTSPLCRKRKLGQSKNSTREKRVKRSHWNGVYVRLDSAALDLGHGVKI